MAARTTRAFARGRARVEPRARARRPMGARAAADVDADIAAARSSVCRAVVAVTLSGYVNLIAFYARLGAAGSRCVLYTGPHTTPFAW